MGGRNPARLMPVPSFGIFFGVFPSGSAGNIKVKGYRNIADSSPNSPFGLAHFYFLGSICTEYGRSNMGAPKIDGDNLPRRAVLHDVSAYEVGFRTKDGWYWIRRVSPGA